MRTPPRPGSPLCQTLGLPEDRRLGGQGDAGEALLCPDQLGGLAKVTWHLGRARRGGRQGTGRREALPLIPHTQRGRGPSCRTRNTFHPRETSGPPSPAITLLTTTCSLAFRPGRRSQEAGEAAAWAQPPWGWEPVGVCSGEGRPPSSREGGCVGRLGEPRAGAGPPGSAGVTTSAMWPSASHSPSRASVSSSEQLAK